MTARSNAHNTSMQAALPALVQASEALDKALYVDENTGEWRIGHAEVATQFLNALAAVREARVDPA